MNCNFLAAVSSNERAGNKATTPVEAASEDLSRSTREPHRQHEELQILTAIYDEAGDVLPKRLVGLDPPPVRPP